MTNKFRYFFPILCLFGTVFLASCTPEETADSSENAVVSVDIEESPTEVPPTEVPPTEIPVIEPAVTLAERVELLAAGFSVQPPVGYSINLDDPEGIQMMAEGANEDSGPMIAIFGGEFGEEMTADQMYEFMVAADETLGEVERLPFENPDADGYIAEFTNTDGGTPVKGRLMLTLIDGQGTLITAMSSPEVWDAGFGELLDAVAQSIEYFPPAE